MSGCSKNAIFPADTKAYDSPVNYAYGYQEFYFESSHGALLRGWLFNSNGPSKGVVVVANDMIFNMSERFKAWTWLPEQGYDLFIFDYRGYGESSGEVDMFGFVDDVSSAIEYAHLLNKDLPDGSCRPVDGRIVRHRCCGKKAVPLRQNARHRFDDERLCIDREGFDEKVYSIVAVDLGSGSVHAVRR